MAGGRPTKLTKALLDKAAEFDFKQAGHAVPTIEGLALHINVNRDTIREWVKEASAPEATALKQEFSVLVNGLLERQALELMNNGLKGKFNAKIANMMLSKHGYVEKSEVDQTVSGAVSFVNDLPRPKRGA